MGIRTFMDLDVWKIAHEVNLSVYWVTEKFPRRDMYTLSAQMRRAAYSVAANITEGFGRRATRDKAHFYTMAAGSSEELKYAFIYARDLGLLPTFADLWAKNESVSKMLRSLTDRVLAEGSKAQP